MEANYAVKSLEEYVSVIREVFGRLAPSKILFFRGCGCATHKLLPSVLRKNYAESDMSHNFRARTSSEDQGLAQDALDRWLFLMQHHGLPTRLLDWTESPLVALHFALHENLLPHDSVVFVLDPTALNECVLGKKWFPDRRDPNYRYRFLKAFYQKPETLPWDIGFKLNDVKERSLPLAVRPVFSHPRMVSQQSAFTVHGDDKGDVEKIFSAANLSGSLARIKIDRSVKGDMHFDLIKFGVSRSLIFPDLDGVAEDIASKSMTHLKELKPKR